MKSTLVFSALLAVSLGGWGSAQSGTPLFVQLPQPPAAPPPAGTADPALKLPFQLLALPDTTTLPAYVKLTLSRPADRLDVTGQPQGMSVTTEQDMLKIETRNVAAGQYTLRITGVWGQDTRTVELLMSIYATGVTAPSSSAPSTTPVTPAPPVQSPVTPAPTPPATGSTSPVPITPVPATPAPTAAPVNPEPVTRPPTLPQAPAPTVPTMTPAAPRTPFSTALPAPIPPGTERFTVWGGLGTEVGVFTGLNLGISKPMWQKNSTRFSVRGTAELYGSTKGGLGTSTLGADLLLSRDGSRLYYGPSTSLSFGNGVGWALGGLLGYTSSLDQGPLSYYLEGRARYARFSGTNTFSPGFKIGVTYRFR